MDPMEKARKKAQRRAWFRDKLKPIWPTRGLMLTAILTAFVTQASLLVAHLWEFGGEGLQIAILVGMLMILTITILVIGPIKPHIWKAINAIFYSMIGVWAGIVIYLILPN